MAHASSLGGQPLSASSEGAPGAPLASHSSRVPPDEQLLALVRAAAPGVESLLYERLAPLVNRLVWSILGPDSEFNDVTHEVFIRILRNIRLVRDPARLEQWAARVTINTVRNEFRRRSSRRWVFWSSDESPEHIELPSPAADLEGRELLARAYRLLATLAPDERVVLSLALVGSNTLDAIAELTACSRSTVKRRLRRARERFIRLARRDPLLAPWAAIAQADMVRADMAQPESDDDV